MSENAHHPLARDEGEGAESSAGSQPIRGHQLPCIFDGLPAGPLDLAALHEAMERDLARRSLATLARLVTTRPQGSLAGQNRAGEQAGAGPGDTPQGG